MTARAEVDAAEGSGEFDAATLQDRGDALAEREMDLEVQRQELFEALEADRRLIAQEREALEARAADLEAMAAQLDRRERELDEREAQIAEGVASGAGLPTSMALDDSEKDQRIAELTRELAEVEERYEQRKAQMMQADAVIKQRRDKVRGYLQQLREHSKQIQAAETKVESSSAQYAGLDRERRNLVEVQAFSGSQRTGDGAQVGAAVDGGAGGGVDPDAAGGW